MELIRKIRDTEIDIIRYIARLLALNAFTFTCVPYLMTLATFFTMGLGSLAPGASARRTPAFRLQGVRAGALVCIGTQSGDGGGHGGEEDEAGVLGREGGRERRSE